MIDLPEFFILDVGHGNCAILQDTEAVTVIDCGFDGAILIETLERLGVDVVDNVIISHADVDHIGGLLPLVKEMPVRNIYLNSDATKKSKAWQELLYTLKVAENQGTKIQVGINHSYANKIVSGEVAIEILAPSTIMTIGGPGGIGENGHSLDSNAMSIVIGLIHNSFRVAILPGDIDEKGLKNLLEYHKDLKARILVFPHHGGNPGSKNGEKFAQLLSSLVKPDLVIFSLHTTRFKNPKQSVMRGVLNVLPNAHIMCTELAQRCKSNNSSLDCTHINNLPARGRVTNSCCGGTIRIKIDGDRTSYSPLLLHQRFVENLPQRLCAIHSKV